MHREGHFFADTLIHRSSITGQHQHRRVRLRQLPRQQHQVSTTLKNFDFFSDVVSRRQVVTSISLAWDVVSRRLLWYDFVISLAVSRFTLSCV